MSKKKPSVSVVYDTVRIQTADRDGLTANQVLEALIAWHKTGRDLDKYRMTDMDYLAFDYIDPAFGEPS